MRPGVLAVRAVNQYRRRDLVTYLAIRYYLSNSAARADRWAREVALDLEYRRSEGVYRRALEFKDIDTHGGIEHRILWLPTGNEAMAEAALLAACAETGGDFKNLSCVYSYNLCEGTDKRGIFKPYMEGFRHRHQAIVSACDACADGVVLYLDIRKFYPSLQTTVALDAWRTAARKSTLERRWREFGEFLITRYAKIDQRDGDSILTGPMFSHLLGNLVLRAIDIELQGFAGVAYFRYVDDIVFVGKVSEVEVALDVLRRRLRDLGLSLHEEGGLKSGRVSARTWLSSRHDFSEHEPGPSWKALVHRLRLFLIQHPEKRAEVQQAFKGEGFRIPVPDFSEVGRERNLLSRIIELGSFRWYRWRARRTTVMALVDLALLLRKRYEREFLELHEKYVNSGDPFLRKRLVPQLRFRAGCLAYLAEASALPGLATAASQIRELTFYSEILRAVATGEVERVLRLGANAARAVAQVLKASDRTASIGDAEGARGPAWEEALGAFFLQGVEVRGAERGGEFVRFAAEGVDLKLMSSDDGYLRELSCLHGLGPPRHPEILEAAFDTDEQLAMDAVDQLQDYLS